MGDLLATIKIKFKSCWVCFWQWKIERVWSREAEFTFYEWKPPATWQSDTLRCKGAGLPKEEQNESPPLADPSAGIAINALRNFVKGSTARCLDVYNGPNHPNYPENGAQVQLYACGATGQPNQDWIFETTRGADVYNGQSVISPSTKNAWKLQVKRRGLG